MENFIERTDPHMKNHTTKTEISCVKYGTSTGKRHRENGPAVEQYNENGNIHYRYWCINGKLHRENGPAVESYYENDIIIFRSWYLNDKQLTEEEFHKFHKFKNKG